MDNQFKFSEHVNLKCKKANSNLYFVRSMVKLNVNTELVTSFFNTVVMSTLMYACVAFYGLLTNSLARELERPVRICRKMRRDCVLDNLYDVYKKSMLVFTKKIRDDDAHPLHLNYNLLPSGRRLRVPHSRTQRFKNTYVPMSISLVNENLNV